MNSIQTRRAAAFVCATVATLTMFTAADVLVTNVNTDAVIAAGQPTLQPTQVVVITGQRAPRS
jgi:hypothetical protein